ncbi:MAG TPA: zf-HC2 domain-containing protein [Thermoanaerobaculia bacterium]|jgi:hypothetical protein
MDHAYIEEHQIADRYVMGTLPPEEAERFEDHYLSCPECLDRLDLAESMQRGFQRVARQDAAKLQATRQLAFVAWLARLGRSRQLAVLLNVLAVLIVLAVLPTGLALREVSERSQQLAQARAALEQERQRSAAGAGSTAAAEKLRSELEASRRDLAGEREARARASEQLAQALQPQGVPILFLDAERSGGPAAGGPTQRLRRPAATGWIVIEAAVDPPSPAPRSYRAVLRGANGRELLRVADLRLSDRQTLSLNLPASLVPPGDYALSVEGLAPGRKPTAAGRFTFRVLPPEP